MYILFIWAAIGILNAPSGDVIVREWAPMGQYDTLVMCKRAATVELKAPKYKCVQTSSK